MAPFSMASVDAGVNLLFENPQIIDPTVIIMTLVPYILSVLMGFFATSTASCWRDTVCTSQTASFTGPWESYSHSPSSRTVSPVNILAPDHSVISSYPGIATLNQNGSLFIFDFGQETGGVVTIKYTATGSGILGLAFSEARNWTGTASDGSDGTYHPGGDGALYTQIMETTSRSSTVPDIRLRGGFRYLSVFTLTDQTDTSINVQITSVTLEIAFQPTWSDLRAYGGYFYSNDDLINRIWYAGAYTLQTNSVPPNTGRVYPLLDSGWRNDAFLGTNGSRIFVDGSKRDRATWAGDLGIALPSAFVSTGDFENAKNALQLQYDLQRSTGELPMAGPPLNFYGSDTYHLTTLIGTYEYILHSADTAFLASNWVKIASALNWIAAKIDSSGLLSVTGTADWGRLTQGGRNTEANALLYRALVTGTIMESWTGGSNMGPTWTSLAKVLKAAINTAALNWDPVIGAFKDSDTVASLHPEDGNSLALQYNMSLPTFFQNISDNLVSNWGPIGAKCPELPNNIVPYVESMEVKGHLAIRQATRALQLMRLSWGWYLNSPYGTGSSTPEGYLQDGSFGYRATTAYGGDYSYTSHAHGWSTGPTHALSFYVLGLQLVSPGGKDWILAPQFGDLTSVEGGYTTPLGKFSAKWAVNVVGNAGYNLSYNVPSTTSGTLVLPASKAEKPKVLVDEKEYTGGTFDASAGTLTVGSQPGGQHSIVVVY